MASGKAKNSFKKWWGKGKTSKKNKLTMAKLQKQVNVLKRQGLGELKQFTSAVGATVLGQFLGASTQGSLAFDITPQPAQGTTHITRNGTEIKLAYGTFSFMFVQMSATWVRTKVRILIMKVKGTPIASATTALNTFLETNPNSNATVRDWYSREAEDYRNNWVKLADKQIIVERDSIETAGTNNYQSVNFKLPMKNHEVCMTDGTTTVVCGQILIFMLCDGGNASASTATTATGAPITVINSGLEVTFTCEWNFYDN